MNSNLHFVSCSYHIHIRIRTNISGETWRSFFLLRFHHKRHNDDDDDDVERVDESRKTSSIAKSMHVTQTNLERKKISSCCSLTTAEAKKEKVMVGEWEDRKKLVVIVSMWVNLITSEQHEESRKRVNFLLITFGLPKSGLVFQFNAENYILSVSPQPCEIYGYSITQSICVFVFALAYNMPSALWFLWKCSIRAFPFCILITWE